MHEKLSKMSTSERVNLAEEKSRRIASELRWLIDLHENNALVVYSPLLAHQIPKSFAAKAFKVVQHSMLYLEIVRLCALWDKPDLAKFSIPTLVNLADDAEFQRAVYDRMELHFTNVGGTWADENTAMQVKSEGSPRLDTEQFGQRQAGKTVQRLKEAIAAARVTSNSEKLRAVRNLRDKSLAHLLEQTREEIQRTVMPVKYGDERDLINETIKIVDGLMLGILGVDYGWENSRRIASNNARALWEGCKIEVLR